MNNEINGGDDGSRQKATNSYVVFSYSSLTFFFSTMANLPPRLGGPTESTSGSPGKTTPRPNTSGDALTEIYQLRLVGTGSNNFLPYRN